MLKTCKEFQQFQDSHIALRLQFKMTLRDREKHKNNTRSGKIPERVSAITVVSHRAI
jgi:hypothetical protein